MDHRDQIPLVDTNGALTPGARGVFETLADRTARIADGLGLSPEFRTWLSSNWHIWITFYRLADKMRMRGRRYYAARTVIEVMRWHYHLRDKDDKSFVHNNNWTPMLARLYNAVSETDFFQTREHGGRVPLE